MISVFLDSDVILDFLLDRNPFSVPTAMIFALAETGRIRLCTTPVSFLNVYYVAANQRDKRTAERLVRQLRSLLSLLAVTESNIDAAMSAGSKDLEARVQYSCAEDNGIDLLVTRNLKHYPTKGLPVVSPDVFLATIPR